VVVGVVWWCERSLGAKILAQLGTIWQDLVHQISNSVEIISAGETRKIIQNEKRVPSWRTSGV